MHPADFSGAPESLLVLEKRGEQCPDIGKSKCEMLFEPSTNGTATHLIQRFAVPPAIHAGLPEPERTENQDPAKEPPVVHVYVRGACSADPNLREPEETGHYI